jgi:dephospho-CoA kinase
VASCKAPVLVVEAIKLLESGRLLPFCDEIWVVIVSEETQLERLLRERGMPEAEARRRIANQMPEAERVGRATRVIANNGTRAELHAQLDAIWSDVTKKYGIADVKSLE